MTLFTPIFYWNMLGLTFMAIEVFFPSFFFALSLSLSSFFASFLYYVDFSLDQTLIGFMITTPLFFSILKILCGYYNRHITYKSSLEDNLHHACMIIKNETTYYVPKIMYQGILWSVKERDDKELYHDDHVRTLYIKGNTFIVIKLS